VARFDLALFFSRDRDTYSAACDYQTRLFDSEAVGLFCERFRTLIEHLLARPDTRIDVAEYEAERDHRTDATNRGRQRMESFKTFRRVQPKPAAELELEPVEFRRLIEDSPLPALCTPASDLADLIDWGATHREAIDKRLLTSGAVLFRGFGIASVPEFERFALAVCPQLYGDYGDLPKESEGQKTYKSTPYPPDKTILFHNESSHTPRWPMRQLFFCVKAAEAGGETPIVDCREVYRRLDPEIRDELEAKGLLYLRNFSGLDVSWQDFFGTSERSEVEAYCREHGIGFEWREAGGLKTWQRGPAVATHPQTREKLFFNQIQLHHVACLDAETRVSIEAVFGEDDLPRSVVYGDGTPIPDAVAQRILDLYWETSVAAPWQEGDVLLVDNMLVAHARNPFRGERKIVVAMGQMFERSELETPALAREA